MDEEVASDARSVVLIVAPTEEANRVEGAFGGSSQKTVPINIFRRGVERKRVLPSSDRGVAIPPRFDHVHLADGARGDEILGLLIDDGTDALRADLKDAIVLLGGFDDGLTVVDLLDHWLFAVDILACRHCVDGDFRMPVVGRPDDDGVDVRPGENFAIVARREDVVAPTFFGASEASVVDVGDGDKLGESCGECGDGIAGTHASGADEGELDFVIRGELAGGLGRALGESGNA